MNPIETARSRRLDAVLTEAVGRDVPSDLEARILARLGTTGGARSRASRWLVAAALLLGGGIVLATASLQGGSRGAAQDPEAVLVTTADVAASIEPVDAPAADEVQARLLLLAKANDANLAIANGVQGHSQTVVTGMSLQTALRAIARDVGAPVAECDGIFAVGVGAKLTAGQARVTLHTGEVSVRAFFKLLHARCGVGFVVGDDVVGRVKVDVDDVAWRDLLDLVAKRCNFGVVGRGSVLAITRRQARVEQRVFFHFEDTSMTKIVTTCSKIAGLNTIIDAGVDGRLTLLTRNADAREALRVAAACVGADVDAGKLVRIQPRPADARTVSATAESCQLATEAKRWVQQLPDIDLTCTAKATMSVFVHQADIRELLRAAATATGHHLQFDDTTFTLH
ncbi:MAG: hypothetical protein ACE37K_19130 [Planctomycetota bacterium]